MRFYFYLFKDQKKFLSKMDKSKSILERELVSNFFRITLFENLFRLFFRVFIYGKSAKTEEIKTNVVIDSKKAQLT